MDLAAVKMDFHYDDWFTKEPNVGYETLLYDVMIGDPTLFMRADMEEQTWRIVQSVLDAWAKESAADLSIYPAEVPGRVRPTRYWRKMAGGGGASKAMTVNRRDSRPLPPIKCSAVISDVDGTLVTNRESSD